MFGSKFGSFGRNAIRCRGYRHASKQEREQQRCVARNKQAQGKTPLPPLRLSFCRLSPLSEQGELRQHVIIVLLSLMLFCIAHGVATPWA